VIVTRSQSCELFGASAALTSVPTQLVIYPGQFHGLSLPSYQRDWEARFIAWMDRYLK